MASHLNNLLPDHATLFGNIDAVQKFTDIFVLNGGGLLDLGARQRHLCDVDTGKLDLILHVIGTDILYTIKELDSSHSLLSQEVTDFNNLLAVALGVGDVDGKVSIAESHLVLEALGDTNNHVVHVGRHSSKSKN